MIRGGGRRRGLAPGASAAARARRRAGRLAGLLLLAALAGAACGGGQRGAAAAEQAPAAAFDAPAAAEQAGFAGVVVDAGGAPLADVAVAMCASACWPTRTDANGRFSYEGLPVERYALDVRGGTVAERSLTSVVFPVELAAGDQELPAPIELQEAASVPEWDGAAPVQVAGLSLIPAEPVDLSALKRAGAAIGGARVPPSGWPDYRLVIDDVPFQPLAMWALRPFGAHLGQPLAVRVAAPAHADAAGAANELAFFSVNPVTGAAEALGPALPDGGAVGTAAGSGVETLTWIILAARSR